MKNLPSLIVIILWIVACQSKEQKMNETIQSKLKTKQSEISYNTCGSGDTALFFVHGWNIDQSYWSDQQTFFCKNYQIVTMDLPGFAGSKNLKNEYSIDSYAKDVKTLIDHLDLKRVILVGHSMGGRVILEAAQNNDKVIAMIGVDNFKDVRQTMTPEVQAEVDNFLQLLKSDFVNTSGGYVDQYLIHPEADSTVRAAIVRSYTEAKPENSIPAIEAYLNYPYMEQERLAKLNVPLFVISSNMSPVDIEGLQGTGLKFDVFDMDRTGHFPMVEQVEAFNKNLKSALEKIKDKVQS